MPFKDTIPVMVSGEAVANVPAHTTALRDALIKLGFRPSCSGITGPVDVGGGSWTIQTITFPPGLFTSPPLVFVTASTGQIIPSCGVSTITVNSANIAGDNRGGSTQTGVRLTWFAVQQNLT
ncbi:hypothetical protein [Arthrobacter sp. GMC3]|uniref:hypothetical protein n=1 Tax=Arthrobacter sp. GMC3 TaxID=2058894 RepID=UPI000CE3782D|nr:hypothetical protein [Arthrobacter sp. GMC3]